MERRHSSAILESDLMGQSAEGVPGDYFEPGKLTYGCLVGRRLPSLNKALKKNQDVQHSKSCSALAKKRTIIPARSECLIQGVPEVPEQFRYAVTDFPSHVSQKGVLVTAAFVYLESETIAVRALNLNNKPKILDKGDVIATCEPVVDIVARPQEFSL
ncbi:hypothetical protein AVEN_64839-1 [Araneus ventricosus]|uniref:Uncharacterized protein n=1 Tax=Araneus ventricosus TaxID=182803 RepID=A0A4Y2GM94_ARAVE|nr:hypothetical protein AVEN_64839-1 [Araneus ventricosus]